MYSNITVIISRKIGAEIAIRVNIVITKFVYVTAYRRKSSACVLFQTGRIGGVFRSDKNLFWINWNNLADRLCVAENDKCQ